MKKTFLKAAIPTLAMLLVAIMALTGTTYAWFTETKKASVTGINVTIDSAGGLKISKDQGVTWLSDIDMQATKTAFKPCSTNLVPSNGILTFYTAKVGNDQTKIKDIAAGNNSILYEIWVKNDSATAMTFDFGTTKITGDGNRAARMAFINKDTNDVVYSYAASDTTTNGLNGQTVQGEVAEQTGNHVTAYTSTDASSTTQATINANSIMKFNVYIWLEGQDADCVNTITSKTFDVSIEFDAEA